MADQELPSIRASNPIVSAISDLVYLTRAGARAGGLAEQVAHTGDNLTAIIAPTVNDDSTVPYIVGSLWIDQVTDKAYVCLDVSVGAAVWVQSSFTGAELKALYEGEADTNAFTDALLTKLNQALTADGTAPLTANWDAGAFIITALQLVSDIVTGTAPLVVASTTVVANLNASLLEGNAAAAFATASQGTLADSALQDASLDSLAKLNALVLDATLGDAADFATAAQGATADSAVQKDGSEVLTGDWEAGAFDIRSLSTHQDAGAAAAAVVQRFGASENEGYEIKVIDETLAALAAISTDLTEDIPIDAYIISVQSNIEELVVAGGTSVQVGIGPVSNPDQYGISAAFTKNLKTDVIPVHAILSSLEDIQVNMVTAAGDIGDTVASAGAVRVRIVYATLNSLDDAA
jgi:hypothetical protein